MHESFYVLDAIAKEALSSEDRAGLLRTTRAQLQPPFVKTQFLRTLLLETDTTKMDCMIRQSDLVKPYEGLFESRFRDCLAMSDGDEGGSCPEPLCAATSDPLLKLSPFKKPRSNSFASTNPPMLSSLLQLARNRAAVPRPSSLPGAGSSTDNGNPPNHTLCSKNHDVATSLSDCVIHKSSHHFSGSLLDSGICSVDPQQPLDLSTGARSTSCRTTNSSSPERQHLSSQQTPPDAESMCESEQTLPKSMPFATSNGYSSLTALLPGSTLNPRSESHLIVFDWLVRMRQLIHRTDTGLIGRCLKDISHESRNYLFLQIWPYLLPLYAAQCGGVTILDTFLRELPRELLASSAVMQLKTFVMHFMDAQLNQEECDILRLAVAVLACRELEKTPANNAIAYEFLTKMIPSLRGNVAFVQSLTELIHVDKEFLRQTFCFTTQHIVDVFLQSVAANSPSKCAGRAP